MAESAANPLAAGPSASATRGAGDSRELPPLSPDERRRYARHLSLEGVGEAGQRRLLAARVLCIGAGGLGSPVALYLAAAGVGTIGIVDSDVVEESNLQRQIIHSQLRLGVPKTESAAAAIRDLNPHARVITHHERLTSANALRMFEGYDIVVDGSDTFATRYLVNDACVLSGKPYVLASVLRFAGYVMSVIPRQSACYRCVFPEPPPPGTMPTCEQAGVFGAVCGMVGSAQAVEVLKLILGEGEPLSNRVLRIDAWGMRTDDVALERDPSCAVCSVKPTVTSLIDYPAWCDGAGDSAPAEISASDLRGELDDRAAGRSHFVLIDVREPFEQDICAIGGAVLVPLGEVGESEFLRALDPQTPVVVMCRSGKRSADACAQLTGRGFTSVRNLAGGILAWIDDVEPALTRY